MPLLSIIIPTLNRYQDLGNTIADLGLQTFQDFEIIIVDQTIDSQDQPYFKNPNVRYFWSEVLSASAARNIGIRQSQGHYLLFLDDDIIIKNRNFLDNHVRHYADPAVPGVAGCIMDLIEQKKMHRHRWSYKKGVGWLFFPRNYGLPAMVEGGGSGNLSVRKNVAIESGGMDENYVKGAHREESDFCLRVVNRYGLFKYDPDADIIHIGSPNGGIRNWSSGLRIVKQQQHFDDSFYFLIKNVKFSQIYYHLVAVSMFFLYDKRYIYRPYLMFVNFYRMLLGMAYGFTRFRRPRYINLQPQQT